MTEKHLNNQSHHKKWIDYAKAFCIILVVYGHVIRGLWESQILEKNNLLVTIDEVIYSFHMPVFFFLAGYSFLSSLHKRGSIKLIQNKVDTIFYPYLLWSLIQGTVKIFLSKYTNHPVSWDIFYNILWYPREQFWFLYTLFFIFLIAISVYKINIYANLLIAVGLYLLPEQMPLPIVVSLICKNYIYFILGSFFAQKDILNHSLKHNLVIPSLASFIIGMIFIQTLTLNHILYNFILLFSATSAIIFICLAFQKLEALSLNNKAIAYFEELGKYSLYIYLIHILTGSGIRIILSKFLHINEGTTHIVIGTLFGIIIPFIIGKIIEGYNLTFFTRLPRKKSL